MNTYQNIVDRIVPLIKKTTQDKFNSLQDKNITQKKDGSFVTDFDTSIDDALRERLCELFPDIPFISEESQPDTAIIKGLAWCIDPIDGTHNFMMDIPYYAVSVGLLFDGRPVAGVIYNPISDELLSGGVGVPVMLEGNILHVTNTSMIVTNGRAHSNEMRILEQDIVQKVFENHALKYRRFGCTALDLMNLVRGRIGAVYILGNSIWDWAAGYAIAEAAEYNIKDNQDIKIIYSKHLKKHIL